jgi:ADP-heptose:LPS heptosyltransferase
MKILLIKLGALGDVLRTTPLLEGLRKRHKDCHITWLVDARHRGVLEGNDLIDRLESLGEGDAWKKEAYDLVINLEKEPEALDAFDEAKGKRKRGFGRDAQGKLAAADASSGYAYKLGIDDDLKFRTNQKSYQEISFEQLDLKFEKEEYRFPIRPEHIAAAQSSLAELGFRPKKGARVVGINTGSGTRFAGKRLPMESYKRIAEKLANEMGATVLLLGGEDERERNAWIKKNVQAPVIDTGSHPIHVFAGIVKTCDLVITGDTTALHVAVAMKTPVLAYFASTCAPEIELYGRGRKIVSAIECAPCYKKICPIDEQCMKDMDVEVFVRHADEMLRDESHDKIRVP